MKRFQKSYARVPPTSFTSTQDSSCFYVHLIFRCIRLFIAPFGRGLNLAQILNIKDDFTVLVIMEAFIPLTHNIVNNEALSIISLKNWQWVKYGELVKCLKCDTALNKDSF